MKFFFFLAFLPTTLLATEVQGVQVQGSCNLQVIPDRGTVSFTAENQLKDQKEAVAKTNEQMNNFKQKITALKLKDLEMKTTNYTVFPVREYERERYVDKGTKASMTIDITTSEISRLGEAMVEASKAGIQNVGSLLTFLSLEKSRSEYLKCLDLASEDARKKAEQLGKKLDFKVGEVLNLIENPTVLRPEPTPWPEKAMMKGTMADAAPVQIDAGTQNFSTTIQVTFDIK